MDENVKAAHKAVPVKKGHIFDLMCEDSAESEKPLWWCADENRRTRRPAGHKPFIKGKAKTGRQNVLKRFPKNDGRHLVKHRNDPMWRSAAT